MSSEAVVQQQVRLTMARMGCQVWRNQVGAMQDENGRVIRFGLANDSAQLNAKVKSSDLICITPVQAYTERTGWTVLGVFTALEIKPSGWTQRPGDDRATAQARFHDIVRAAGGYAGFVTDPADVARIVGLG